MKKKYYNSLCSSTGINWIFANPMFDKYEDLDNGKCRCGQRKYVLSY